MVQTRKSQKAAEKGCGRPGGAEGGGREDTHCGPVGLHVAALGCHGAGAPLPYTPSLRRDRRDRGSARLSPDNHLGFALSLSGG